MAMNCAKFRLSNAGASSPKIEYLNFYEKGVNNFYKAVGGSKDELGVVLLHEFSHGTLDTMDFAYRGVTGKKGYSNIKGLLNINIKDHQQSNVGSQGRFFGDATHYLMMDDYFNLEKLNIQKNAATTELKNIDARLNSPISDVYKKTLGERTDILTDKLEGIEKRISFGQPGFYNADSFALATRTLEFIDKNPKKAIKIIDALKHAGKISDGFVNEVLDDIYIPQRKKRDVSSPTILPQSTKPNIMLSSSAYLLESNEQGEITRIWKDLKRDEVSSLGVIDPQTHIPGQGVLLPQE